MEEGGKQKEETQHSAYTRPRTVPVPTSQNEKQQKFMGRGLRRALSRLWGIINPRLEAILILPKKAHGIKPFPSNLTMS